MSESYGFPAAFENIPDDPALQVILGMNNQQFDTFVKELPGDMYEFFSSPTVLIFGLTALLFVRSRN